MRRSRPMLPRMFTFAQADGHRAHPVGPFAVDLVGDPGAFACAFAHREIAPGLDELTLTLEADGARPPPELAIRLRGPAAGIDHVFVPHLSAGRSLWPDYDTNGHASRGTHQAPVQVAYGADGRNRVTLAVDDCVHECRIGLGVREEDCALIGQVHPFLPGRADFARAELRLRVDRRDGAWHDGLAAAAAWWAEDEAQRPLPTPPLGRAPMYSTWYALHQAVDPDAVLAQCRLARELGMEAVIVDDGWQTLDTARGYAHAGDWQPERIPDVPGFVAAIHVLGMGVLLWYSLPHAGFETAVYRRFAERLLRRSERLACAILDPRIEEVRAHLIDTVAGQFRAWDLDGVKIDFVDAFRAEPGDPPPAEGDCTDVDDAVARLLRDLTAALRRTRAEVLIEFRQAYVGPRMQACGNLLRAADCPYDAARNRGRTLTLRHLAPGSTVHGDMLMWHVADRAEDAARQFLATLFAVPQISVLLDRIPAPQRAMLRFWLGWWRDHRPCLLDGHLHSEAPEAGWPLAWAETAEERIVACYADRVVRCAPDLPPTLWLVNATAGEELVVDFAEDAGTRACTVRDCTGTVVAEATPRLAAGLHRIAVPASGLVELATPG